MSNFKEIIKQHLESMAVADNSFAERYADKSKNLDACVNYIKEKARKQATSGMAAIEDDIVYGWAAHYYQEKNLKEEKTLEDKYLSELQEGDDEEENISCSVTIHKKRKIEKNSDCIELDLFGGTL